MCIPTQPSPPLVSERLFSRPSHKYASRTYTEYRHHHCICLFFFFQLPEICFTRNFPFHLTEWERAFLLNVPKVHVRPVWKQQYIADAVGNEWNSRYFNVSHGNFIAYAIIQMKENARRQKCVWLCVCRLHAESKVHEYDSNDSGVRGAMQPNGWEKERKWIKMNGDVWRAPTST